MIEESDRLASLLKEHPELEEEEYVPSEEFLKQIKGEMKSSDPLLDARYGLLKNSEQTNMPGASAPTLSQVKIDTFLGADLTNSPANADENRSPDCENMIRDVPGKVRKRMGWQVKRTLDGRINGYHALMGHDPLVHAGTKLYKRDLPQALAAQGLTGGMSESALAGMYNSYGNNRNTIDRGRNESLAALLDTLNSNRSSALQSYNSQLSAAEQQKMAYQMQLEQALANGSAEILQNKYDTLQNLDNAYAQQILALQQAAAQAAQKRW